MAGPPGRAVGVPGGVLPSVLGGPAPDHDLRGVASLAPGLRRARAALPRAAGAHAGNALRGILVAHDPSRDAGAAPERLRAHGASQGPGRGAGGPASRPPERAA